MLKDKGSAITVKIMGEKRNWLYIRLRSFALLVL